MKNLRFTLTAADRKALKDARKVLQKVSKWAKKMEELDEQRISNPKAEWKNFALDYWADLDKLYAAHVEVNDDNVTAIYSKWR